MAPELVAGGGYGGLIREKPHCALATFDTPSQPARSPRLVDSFFVFF